MNGRLGTKETRKKEKSTNASRQEKRVEGLTRRTPASGILVRRQASKRAYWFLSRAWESKALKRVSSLRCSSDVTESCRCMSLASSSTSSSLSSPAAAAAPPLPPTRLGVASLEEAASAAVASFFLRPRFFLGGPATPLTTLPLTILTLSTDGERRWERASSSNDSGGKLVWRRGWAEGREDTERFEALRRLRVGVLGISPAVRFLGRGIEGLWYGGDVAVGECDI